MNWRTIVGIILVLCSIMQMYYENVDYRDGKIDIPPYYMLISFVIVVFLAFLLIRKGMQVDRRKIKK
jgi:hypothetical protein